MELPDFDIVPRLASNDDCSDYAYGKLQQAQRSTSGLSIEAPPAFGLEPGDRITVIDPLICPAGQLIQIEKITYTYDSPKGRHSMEINAP